MPPLLQVQDLRMYYKVSNGEVKAVDDVSFEVERGTAVGFAGESGCGKSSLASAILRTLPDNARIVSGSVLLDGENLFSKDEEQMRQMVRWRRISMVFQGAMNAFCPVVKVGDQIVEAIMEHDSTTIEQARSRAKQVLSLVGIDPKRANNYPFEFSGGMKQRAMLAMALVLSPDLVIADEPTTALDVIVQAQVLDLIKDLRTKLNLSMILISHDISAIARSCSTIAIMYAGKIVEMGPTESVILDPKHPYTQGLLGAFPSITASKTKRISIPGSPPDLLFPPSGCRFHPRCPFAMDICKTTEPELTRFPNAQVVACHLHG